MKATDFTTAASHLNDLLGIDLTKRLVFARPNTLQDFAVVGTLVVIFRYAEALGKTFVIHDMTTGGHQSHYLGTELDFDLNSPRYRPVAQLNVVADLLRIWEGLKPELDAFRIGFYFDNLTHTDAETLEQFTDKYGDGRTASSLHLGVRYRWTCPEYRGLPIPATGSPFVLWGRGKKAFGKSDLWIRRIRSWDVGLLKDQAFSLGRTVIARDFRALDYNPPPLSEAETLTVAP
jgi:hypothetical protein